MSNPESASRSAGSQRTNYLTIKALGACRGLDKNTFFPKTVMGELQPKEICLGCRVVSQCLEYALEANVEGIWGATNRSERLNIIDEKEQAAAE
jgi:hypothetical protein